MTTSRTSTLPAFPLTAIRPEAGPVRPGATAGSDSAVVAVVVGGLGTTPAAGATLADVAATVADTVRETLRSVFPGTPVSTAIALPAGPDPNGTSAAPVTPDQRTPPNVAELDGLTVDRWTRRAGLRGHALDLTYREFELLAFLVENPNRVFTRTDLLHRVWDSAEVGSRTVDVHVRRLRVKLGAEAGRLMTVRNVGYRLVAAPAAGVDGLETVA